MHTNVTCDSWLTSKTLIPQTAVRVLTGLLRAFLIAIHFYIAFLRREISCIPSESIDRGSSWSLDLNVSCLCFLSMSVSILCSCKDKSDASLWELNKHRLFFRLQLRQHQFQPQRRSRLRHRLQQHQEKIILIRN